MITCEGHFLWWVGGKHYIYPKYRYDFEKFFSQGVVFLILLKKKVKAVPKRMGLTSPPIPLYYIWPCSIHYQPQPQPQSHTHTGSVQVSE